jgi:hypothetical protein
MHFLAEGNVTIQSNENLDSIQVTAGNCTFESFHITMFVSDAWTHIAIEGGHVVFKKCLSESDKTITALLRQSGRAVFIDCTLKAVRTPALRLSRETAVFCQNCTFSSEERDAVSVSGNCKVDKSGPERSAFHFEELAQFLFENGTVNQPFCAKSGSDCPLIRNCKISDIDLKVEGARLYLHTCEFQEVALETQKAGVSILGCRFGDGAPEPPLRVLKNSKVAVYESEFVGAKAATALFHDLAGAGVFVLGQARSQLELEIEGCGFGNVAASGIVVTGGAAKVDISGSLFERVNGAGAVFGNPARSP